MAVSAVVFSTRKVRTSILAVALATNLMFVCLLAGLGDRPASAEPASAKSTSPLTEPVGTMWSGDASRPLSEQWASISDQEHCSVNTSSSSLPDSRITVGSDSRFARGVAVRYHMNTGDKSCFSGRSELAMGTKFGHSWPYMIQRGHEGWYAFQVLFPSTYPLNSATVADGGVMQFHGYGGSGGVPFGISAGRLCHQGEGPGAPHPGGPELGYIKAWIKAASPEEKNYCLSEEVHANTVYEIVIHARFAEDPSGFVEVFWNGTKKMEYKGTFGFVPEANSILRSGLYPDTSRSESPAMDLYEGGWTLASTREAAEAAAFGTLQEPPPTPTPTEPPTEETGYKRHVKGQAAAAIPTSPSQTAAVQVRVHRNDHRRSRTVQRGHYTSQHHAKRHERSHGRGSRALRRGFHLKRHALHR
jgi:hypothetical protein